MSEKSAASGWILAWIFLRWWKIIETKKIFYLFLQFLAYFCLYIRREQTLIDILAINFSKSELSSIFSKIRYIINWASQSIDWRQSEPEPSRILKWGCFRLKLRARILNVENCAIWLVENFRFFWSKKKSRKPETPYL